MFHVEHRCGTRSRPDLPIMRMSNFHRLSTVMSISRAGQWGLLLSTCLLSACVPVVLTAAGVGGGAYANHQMGGTTYRTFSEPLPKIREATALAFKRMGIRLDSVEKEDQGEMMYARAGDRKIEVELEALTSRTTRMRVVTRKDGGLVLDAATSIEIISQTEKVLTVR